MFGRNAGNETLISNVTGLCQSGGLAITAAAVVVAHVAQWAVLAAEDARDAIDCNGWQCRLLNLSGPIGRLPKRIIIPSEDQSYQALFRFSYQ